MSVQLKPFYMWAGGKTKVVKSYKNIWPDMNNYDNYVEPFFGGGAVFCWLRNNQLDRNMDYFIGDINKELMGVTYEVRDNPENFIKACTRLVNPYLKLEGKDARKKWYYEQRKMYWKRPTPARLYVLMRTGFNGIWQTCKDANGLFATPAGLLNQTKIEQILDKELILTWSTALRNTSIHIGGYDTMKLPTYGKTLIYLDPPYRDSFTNYSTGFSDKDQEKLITWFRQQTAEGHKVLMSNRCVDGDPFFEERLGDIADFHYINVVYTAGRRKNTADGFEAKPARELLIISKQ